MRDIVTVEIDAPRADPPRSMQLFLDSPKVTVSITARFHALSPERTEFTSDEVFRFRGLVNKVFSVLARRSIRKAHRQQIESFKRFAETVA